MPQLRDTVIFHLGNNFYVEKKHSDGSAIHHKYTEGWVMDLSLDGTIEINGIELEQMRCRLSYVEAGERVIRQINNGFSAFLSVGIHENPYEAFQFKLQENEYFISDLMIYPLLKIISILRDENAEPEKYISLKCYIQLLQCQRDRPDSRNCAWRFEELSKIYLAVTDLLKRKQKFPLPSEIIAGTGIKNSRFQKACLVIFGNSLQKILQHQKLTLAFHSVVDERKEINAVSVAMGYKHSPNFITAFHNHFSLTPMEAVRYHAT